VCNVDNACHIGVPWGVAWITAMFLHASWDHILGNLLFLAIFGENVEDAFGRLGYLLLYFAGGFVATMTQTAMTLLFGSASDAQLPTLGASGAIAAVLGANLVLYPNSRIRTLMLWFPVSIPPWVFLGGWFLYQFFESNYSLVKPNTGGSGVAFFAPVGGIRLPFPRRESARWCRPNFSTSGLMGLGMTDSLSLVGVVVGTYNDGGGARL
jgi:membrane associated rhomboid family serine protease